MCNMFRPLTASEVECRAAQVGKSKNGPWVSLLIYKDARVDQKLLDEVVGPMNWQNSYEFIDNKLFCTVSIWDEKKGVWISKQNVGTESNTEKEKGQASDAFKRACFHFGIGRDLSSSPKIFINLAPEEYDAEKNRCKVGFSVSAMHSTDGVIDKLVIVDSKNKVRFSFPRQEDPTIIQRADPNTGEAEPLPKSFVSVDGKSKLTIGGKVWMNFVQRVRNGEVTEDGTPLALKVQGYYNLPDNVMNKFYQDVDNV